jgi:hypothetical protein
MREDVDVTYFKLGTVSALERQDTPEDIKGFFFLQISPTSGKLLTNKAPYS